MINIIFSLPIQKLVTLHQYDQISFLTTHTSFYAILFQKMIHLLQFHSLFLMSDYESIMSGSGIEHRSYEIKLKKNKRTRNSPETSKQKQQRQLLKQQESFNNYANYYYFLVNQNREAIERLVWQLQQDANKHAYLIKILKKCLMGQMTTFSNISEIVMKDLLNTIKEKIQLQLKYLNKDEIGFYQSVLKDNIELSQSIKKQCNIISEWTIQKLYNLDMLSIFFEQGQQFIKNCNSRIMPLNKEAVPYVFGLSITETNKLLKIYRETHNFLRKIENRRIRQMVNIYHLFVLRIRMYCIVAKARRTRINESQYANTQPIFKKKILQEEDLDEQHSQHTQYYNFCQIAFWSTQRDIQQQTYSRKVQIVQQLQKANTQKDNKALSKALLFIKIRQNISFDSIFKVNDIIAKNQIQSIRNFLKAPKLAKTAQLAAKIPYIFVKDDTLEDAFEKSGLSKKYDLKNFDRLVVSRMGLSYTFANVIIRQSRQLMVQLHNMLKRQLNHKHELIVIKKLAISFDEITTNSKDKSKLQKQDLICNLILITSQNRILSSCIVRGPIIDQKYVRILKRMMKNMRLKPESIILLYQIQPGKLPQQRAFWRFYFHILKTYHIRLYAINAPLYCKLALLTFSYIKMQILSRKQQITRQNFYEILEAQITASLYLLSRVVIQPHK